MNNLKLFLFRPDTIYATSTSSAVCIGRSNYSLPAIDTIHFVSTIFGKTSTTANITSNAVVIDYLNNKTIKDGIYIEPQCCIKGKNAIAINDNITTDIINNGTIEGVDNAFYFKGNACILNGTITNDGIIIGTNALYSDTQNPVTTSTTRNFTIYNDKKVL
jgi:hypothetical protein